MSAAATGGERASPEDAVERYEQHYARAAGGLHAVSFAYARTALVATLRAAGLERGDEVVLSPLTCRVVPLALLFAGLRPVYVDIRADTLNLDARAVHVTAGSAARAILFQHTYGWSGGLREVAALAVERGFSLIEDRAQCLPIHSEHSAGRAGRAAVYSNNPGKPLPAGSGGVAVTDDAALARAIDDYRAKLPRRGARASIVMRVENALRNRLPPSLYWAALAVQQRLHSGKGATLEEELAAEVDGVAWRIADRDALNGERWLLALERIARHRSTCCAEYAAALRDLPGLRTITGAEPGPLYYFPVLVDDKPALLRRARERRVQVIAWPILTPIYPVESQDELARYGYIPGSCPVAEQVARRLVGLPTDLAIGPAHRTAVMRLLAGR